MSRTIVPSTTILFANAADVTQANAAWHSIEGVDQVIFDIQIVGTANATLDFDLHNGNAATQSNTYNANAQVVLDDPCGQVRAYSNNTAAGESVTVKMRPVIWNSR